jgi:drug/metabolite transporter (DMT)-like permease
LINKLKNSYPFFIILIIISMMIWGGSWVSAKFVSSLVAPEVLVFWRFLITFLSFIPVVIIFKENLKVDIKSLIILFICALILAVYNFLFFTGLKIGFAGAGGVLVTCINPIFTFIISLIIFKVKIHLKEAIGLILGLIGGLVILQIWNISISKLLLSGNLVFLIASLSWATLTIVSQRVQKKVSLFVFSFYLYGFSTLITFFFALPHGIITVFDLHISFWLNILYLAIISTTFATTVFFLGSRRLGSNSASSFMFLVPVSALFFSFIILHEIPNIFTISGGILAMTAVYLINYKGIKKRKTL